MTNLENYQAPDEINRWRTLALGIGGIGLIIWAVGCYFDSQNALRSWLLGFIFWGGIGVGGLGVLILQYLTGGAWGVVIRRTVEAASRTLLILPILFIPLAVGVTHLYEWTHLENDPIIQGRGWYLTVGGWIARAVVYFILWGVMAYLLNKWSANQDKAADMEESAKWLGTATAFSGPTMVAFALVVTFAAVDWVMTLEPHWFSTIWGMLFIAGWGLSCFCFVVAILALLSDKAPMNRVLGKRHFHDLGKLMLALVMVWAYFNFSQYLIIWSGNIPEETGWYLTRTKGVWGVIGLLLILFHFAFPFLILLQQDFKRKAKLLAGMGVFILVMRLVDMFYLIAPSPLIEHGGGHEASHFSWLYLVGPIAVGGLWLAFFFYQLKQRPMVPINDPFLENAIKHGKGH
ncbi:MAG: hypothetical protein LUM44_03695 [Pyrinomonadaceae bacterium]|nr:hypothetical protein [Pyrinomonadaceae bacterium]